MWKSYIKGPIRRDKNFMKNKLGECKHVALDSGSYDKKGKGKAFPLQAYVA